MKIAFAADKPGFPLKNALIAYVEAMGHQAMDMGTTDVEQVVPFTKGASNVAKAIQSGRAERGILICGTGMGMAITANKFKGVYAAVCESTYSAMYSRKINNANALCLGGFMIGQTLGEEITEIFLNTGYTQDFPQWRVDLLNGQSKALGEIETENFH